jgi:hypothetical protein
MVAMKVPSGQGQRSHSRLGAVHARASEANGSHNRDFGPYRRRGSHGRIGSG